MTMTKTGSTEAGHAARPADREPGSTDFERHRSYLIGLAYRMLGSVADAEDAVQEAWIRWHRVDNSTIAEPRAFLAKTVARLCLDQMKSARARRETYVGPWLPEPVLDSEALAADTTSEYATDLTVGLMLALERLTPLERAAFLLHDVFDVSFGEVAELLGRNEAACRQLTARARAHVREARPRAEVAPADAQRITDAFVAALHSGKVDGFARMLAADAVLYGDGGGKRSAALNPIRGRDHIARFMEGVLRKFAEPIADLRTTPINGMPGLVITSASGDAQTVAFEVVGGEVTAIYAVRNPDKLAHLGTGSAGRSH